MLTSKVGVEVNMNEILRMEYLNQIREYKDKHRIKVITGIRRSGKSTLLSQFKDVLKNEFKINSSQIIDYDFNNKELAELT
jgi:predicted AAA+ superfamily ATPase